MNFRRSIAAAAVAVFAAMSINTAQATTYNGSLSYLTFSDPTNALTVAGPENQWQSYNISLSWQVSDEEPGAPASHPWKYSYAISFVNPSGGALQGAVSHMLLETSTSFTQSDFTGLAGANFAGLGSQIQASGNPGLPDAVYGMRLDPLEESFELAWSFYSNRDPVWGDFYAKCGGKNGQNTIYNSGFTMSDLDPAAGPSDGSVGFHILRPDSTMSPPPVPEPLTISALGVAAAGLVGYMRRRSRKLR